MAPKPRRTPHLELREPEPLRIVKRGQTIAGCAAPREVEYGGRGTSNGSEESRGSPPMTVDRPLTVHKRRGGRGTVLNGSFEEPTSPVAGSGSAISELIKKNAGKSVHSSSNHLNDSKTRSYFKARADLKVERTVLEDPDLTPKAVKQVPRTVSAGGFLKSELYSSRSSKHSDNSSDRIHMSQLNGYGTQISPPKLPERRLSKSKTFFFKLGGRKDKESKPEKWVDSTTSKNTLIRRLSRGTDHNSSTASSYTDSIQSADSSYSLPNSKDIADVIIDSRIPSRSNSSIHSISPGSMQNWATPTREEFILCPEITITPEVASLDAASTNIWVAVEVAGSLRLANTHEQTSAKLREGRRTISGANAAHLRNFGRLHSMRIDFITTRDSSILELVGNIHESKIVYAGETHLILAKLRIAKVTKGTSHIRECSTSDEIMTDLENHLGGAVTSYLTVRLSYKHSGFLNYKRVAIDWEGGTSSHTTRLQTEASAYIKRHNLESAWSPRTSQELNGPLEANPLIKLIDMHLPADKAREAMRRLADERVPIPMARRIVNTSDTPGGSSEDTVKVRIGSNIAARLESAVCTTVLQPQSNVRSPADSDTQQSLAPPVSHAVKAVVEIDPARKIWTQMRKNSRGHRNYRTSISDDHDSNDSDDCSPSRLSSADNIDEERNKIKAIALRNKRSVGADTLKSFAPSVGKANGGTIGGLGLGMQRSWWGGNWW